MSIDISTLGIEVRSNDVATATDRLNRLPEAAGRAESATNSLSSSTDKLAGYLKAAAAALASWKLAEYIRDATMLAARVETLGVVMRVVGNNAGYTGAQMDTFTSQLKKMGITTQESMSSLIKMAGAQMDLTKASQLARVAQDAAVIGGINSSEAFGRLIQGIRSGEVEILKTIGINVQFEQGYKQMAATLGKTTDQLTNVEKTSSRMSQVLAFGTNIAGAYEASMSTAGKQMLSMARYSEELQLKVGQIFTPALTVGVETFVSMLKLVDKYFDVIKIAAGASLSVLAGYGVVMISTSAAGTAMSAIFSIIASRTLGMTAAMLTGGGVVAGFGVTTATTTVGLAGMTTAMSVAAGGTGLFAAATVMATGALNALKLSMMTHPIGWIIAALTTAVGLWFTYKATQAEALKGPESTENTILQNLRDEIALLERRNKAIKEGASKSVTTEESSQLAALQDKAKLYRAMAQKSDPVSAAFYKSEADSLENQIKEIQKLIAIKAAAQKEYSRLTAPAPTPATDKEIERWRATYADLRKEISALNPAMTEHERALADVENKYTDLMGKKGADITLLKQLKQENLDAVNTYYNTAAAIRATSEAFKEYLRLAESEPPQNNEAGDMNLRWEEELKLLKSLQPSADIDKLNEQIAMFERLLSDIPGKSDEVAAAIAKLKADFASASGVIALQQSTKDIEISLIKDPYEREKAAIQERYDRERELQEKALKDAEKDASKRAAIEKHLAALKKEYNADVAENSRKSSSASLSATATYTSMAAELFTSLASAQDQGSRKGFESAKNFNLAAAVMSTASGIMAQLSGPDGWTPMAWVRAALVGVMGAVNIAKIASTSFGGGGSVSSVPAGSFGGGTGGMSSVGSGIGSRVTSAHDNQTQDSLQSIAGSMENASLAITRVADGLTKISDLFTEGGFLSLTSGAAPGIGGEVGEARSKGWFKTTTGLDGFAKFTDPLTVFKNIGSGLFGWGNQFQTTGGGFTLGMDGGELDSQNYIEQKKAGGWFKKSKTRTIYGDGDPAFESALQSALDQIKSTIIRSAAATGTTASLDQAQMDQVKIATAGRKPEDIQKDLEKWFTDASNSLAMTVEGLQDFAFYGENAFDALVRLSTSLQGVNEMFELTGHTLITSSLSGADAAYRLADAFGGLDKMKDSVNEYFEGMFTEAERDAMTAAQNTRQVGAAFNEMSLAVPRTRQEFRSLVNSLDVMTDAGASLYVSLMEAAPAFIAMAEAADKAAEAQREVDRDLTSRWLHATKNAEADLYDLRVEQADEYQDYLERGMDTTRLATVQQTEYANAVKAVADAAREAGETFKSALITPALSAANAMKSIQGGNLSTLSPEELYRQKRGAWDDAMAKGETGKLGQLGQELLTASRGYNASGAGYVSDYDMVMKALDVVAGGTSGGVNSQISLLEAIRDNTGLTVTATTTLSELMLKQTASVVNSMVAGITPKNLMYDINGDKDITIADVLGWLKKGKGLPAFAMGGITSGPSIAGEASREAVIPLPDGRTVPVTLFADNYTADMVAELRELRKEVAELRGVATAGNRIAQAVGEQLVGQGEEGNRQRGQMVQAKRLAGTR